MLLIWLLLSLTVRASGSQDGTPEREQWFKRVDASKLADMEQRIETIYAKIAPSVVRIYPTEDASGGWFSGVIVSPAGEIMTCAHYDLPPETPVVVELADGARTKGMTLGLVKLPEGKGRYRAHDVGMIRLIEKKVWPAAALGSPMNLENGAHCLAVGSPSGHEPRQPPLLRLGRIVPPNQYGQVRATCRIRSGDSGGPLLDLEGRVLGVLSTTASFRWAGSDYASADVYKALRQELSEGKQIAAAREHLGRPYAAPKYLAGAFEPATDLSKAIGAAHQSTVEILGDGKPVALGLIVSADWAMTKRTEVECRQSIACRFADDRVSAARIVRGSKEHDLALLKVDSGAIPVAILEARGAPRIGQIVASLALDPSPLGFGVIGGVHVANPPVRGYLPISGQPTTPAGQFGHVFSEVWPNRPEVGDLRDALVAGDLITHVDGLATPTPDDYVAARDKRIGAADAVIGERIRLTIRRGEKTMQVFAPIVQSTIVSELDWKQSPKSLRRNGFPNVFSHDGGIAPHQCGGPVVDRSGRIIGINIARADEVQTFAIPAAVAQKVLAELMRSAEN